MKNVIQIILSALTLSTLMSCQISGSKDTSAPREPSAAGTPQVSKIPKTKADVDSAWVKIGKDKKDSMIRSNPVHYWAWMKMYSSEFLSDIVKYEGQITADPHYYNFGDIHSKNQPGGLALVDIDDSGVGSVYLDFVRYVLFTRAILNQDYTNELLTAYIEGLQKSKSPKVPKNISDAMKKSYNDLVSDNSDWVSDNLKRNYELDNEKLSDPSKPEEALLGMKKVDEETKKKAKTLATALEKSGKINKIYDEGYKSTRSGSSKGLDRFWYSAQLSSTGKNIIIECKQQALFPATAYYSPQNIHSKRVNDVLKIYSDFEIEERFIIDANKESYWCRPREWQYMKRSPVEKMIADSDKSAIVSYSAYLAYWLGFKASSQVPKEYTDKLRTKKDTYIKATQTMLNKYEEEIFKAEKNK